MHARVSTYRFEANRADDVVAAFETGVGAVEQMEGQRGVYLLIDRENGKAITITLWESADALASTAAAADQIRSDATSSYGGSIESVESYEVALHETP